MSFWLRASDGPVVADEPSDDALVTAARADRHAFASLYRRHLPSVYRYCYLKLGSKEAAEDAVSDIFLKAYSGLDGYRDNNFAGWLYRIAQHTVVDHARRRRPQLSLEAASEVVGQHDTEAAALSEIGWAALQAAVAQLNDEQQTVLALQFAGWSSVEIGKLLGKSDSSIRVTRHRAFARLRVLLKDED